MNITLVLNIGDEVVIFGGGQVALRKVKYISNFTKKISVVAEKSFNLPQYVNLKIATINKNNISKFIPKSTALVITALSDSNINHEIAEWCNDHHILVNVVDDPEFSTVLFPALSIKNDLNISISTNGKCPFLARKIREDVDIWIEEKSRWLQVLGPIRKKLVGIDEKNKVLNKIYNDSDVKKLIKEGEVDKALNRAWEVFDVYCKH